MEELSYSFHLSNDKNKTIKAKQEALNSPSGTTSKNNNAIQNIKHLGKVNHHNLDNMIIIMNLLLLLKVVMILSKMSKIYI